MEFSNLCNYNLNRTTFQIVFHKPTSQTLCQNIMGFQIKKLLSVTEQGIDFCRGLKSCISGILGDSEYGNKLYINIPMKY